MEILVIFVVYICKLLPYFDKNSAIFCFSEPVIDNFSCLFGLAIHYVK